jgi:hypothetical protein
MTLFLPHSDALTSAVPNPSVDDLSVLLTRRPNALLSGPREATHTCLLKVKPGFRLPIRRLACDDLGSLPPPGGTVILDDVEVLDGQQQETLLRWLDEGSHAEMQVISITAATLYDRVRAGTFLQALYYRLNVIHIELGPARTEA